MLKSRKDEVEEMYILTKKVDDVLLPMVVKRDGLFQLAWSRSLFKLQDRYADVADKIVIEADREDFDALRDMVNELNDLTGDFVSLDDGATGVLHRPIAIHPRYGEPSFRWQGYTQSSCGCGCDCDTDYD